jgi:hypothetical protein
MKKNQLLFQLLFLYSSFTNKFIGIKTVSTIPISLRNQTSRNAKIRVCKLFGEIYLFKKMFKSIQKGWL